MKEIPKNVSESVRRLNPHLYTELSEVGGVQPKKRKQNPLASLEGRARRSKTGVCKVECIVTFVNHRSRLLDDDNLISGFKVLRDVVARSIGIDDGDSRLLWQYHQLETKGAEGTLVIIERL